LFLSVLPSLGDLNWKWKELSFQEQEQLEARIATIFTAGQSDSDAISLTLHALKLMDYRMKSGGRLTKSIFEDFERRFSSEKMKRNTTGSFAPTVFTLSTLCLELTSCPEEIREVIYNVVVRVSFVLSSEDIGKILFG
jgi:hypothetical protein